MSKKKMILEQDVAHIYGSPGIHPRFIWVARYFLPLVPVLFACGYFVRALFPVPALSTTLAGAFVIIFCLIFLYLLNKAKNAYTGFIKGAKGEERVARGLRLLPATYCVFHGVDVLGKGQDIDHVVVGPTGVVVVETKNWSGAVSVDNQTVLYNGQTPDRDPLVQVRASAHALCEFLELPHTIDVTPVLCFASDEQNIKPTGSAGVVICSATYLQRVIMKDEQVALDTVQIEQWKQKIIRKMEGV